MQIKVFRSPWGMPLMRLEDDFRKVREAGFHGTETLVATPEFGTDPYMPLVPCTHQPLGNL